MATCNGELGYGLELVRSVLRLSFALTWHTRDLSFMIKKTLRVLIHASPPQKNDTDSSDPSSPQTGLESQVWLERESSRWLDNQ